MSKYFYKRVGVAVLDLGYPSNFATFGDLFDELPALIIKHPNRVHKMFHHEDIHAGVVHIEHHDLDKWGEVISHDDLGLFTFWILG